MENSGVVHMLKNNKTDGKLLLEYFKNCFLSCMLLIAKHDFDSCLSFEVELSMNVNLFILKRKKKAVQNTWQIMFFFLFITNFNKKTLDFSKY